MSFRNDPYRSFSIREGVPLAVLLITALVALATWRTPDPRPDVPPISEANTSILAILEATQSA